MIADVQTMMLGECTITPQLDGDTWHSLGAITVRGIPLRNPVTRFAPWFDAYTGEIFRTLRLDEITQRKAQTRIRLTAISDPDYPFMERRDVSGDVCLPPRSWDAPPLEAEFSIVLQPAETYIDGYRFSGLTYWYEYAGDTPIHRILDRQTWEVGGNLDDVTVLCRNLFDAPKARVTRDGGFSTVGLDNWAGALPGNLWARWSLLPSFDMQVGRHGVLLGWFDEVSCIRTVVESTPGEDWVRYVDLHYFTQAQTARTNPKTVLYCPDVLDDVQMLNLWTHVHDAEMAKARRQFGMPAEEAPAPLVTSHNAWQGIDFATAYEDAIEHAAEFGADYVFIDSVFQNGETYRATIKSLIPPENEKGTVLEKFQHGHMCLTFDFEVSETAGGEVALKALCERAQAQGVQIMSWMSTHYWPYSTLLHDKTLGHGRAGVVAAKESGFHPDTGYASDCWTLNLNSPVFDKLRAQFLGVCARTGLAGYLWDSFSNLSWWQVDYSDGSMRPQYDRTMQLFADLTQAGLYIQPEAMVGFSGHSACGPFGVDRFQDDLLGYAHRTVLGLHYADSPDTKPYDHFSAILRGKHPFDLYFRSIAYGRISELGGHRVPRDERDPAAEARIKELVRVYKTYRHLMQRRVVLPEYAGVRWENTTETHLLFTFHRIPAPAGAVDAGTQTAVADGWLAPNRVYLIPGE